MASELLQVPDVINPSWLSYELGAIVLLILVMAGISYLLGKRFIDWFTSREDEREKQRMIGENRREEYQQQLLTQAVVESMERTKSFQEITKQVLELMNQYTLTFATFQSSVERSHAEQHNSHERIEVALAEVKRRTERLSAEHQEIINSMSSLQMPMQGH